MLSVLFWGWGFIFMRIDNNFSVEMITAILAVVLMLSIGQVLFKYAAHSLDIAHPLTLLSASLVAALVLYGVATICWLVVLSRVPLSIAFPFYGLVFVLVPMMSWIILKEPMRLSTIFGSAVIVVGVLIVAIGGQK